MTATVFWAFVRSVALLKATVAWTKSERDVILDGFPEPSQQLLILQKADHTKVLYSSRLCRKKLFPETVDVATTITSEPNIFNLTISKF